MYGTTKTDIAPVMNLLHILLTAIVKTAKMPKMEQLLIFAMSIKITYRVNEKSFRYSNKLI